MEDLTWPTIKNILKFVAFIVFMFTFAFAIGRYDNATLISGEPEVSAQVEE